MAPARRAASARSLLGQAPDVTSTKLLSTPKPTATARSSNSAMIAGREETLTCWLASTGSPFAIRCSSWAISRSFLRTFKYVRRCSSFSLVSSIPMWLIYSATMCPVSICAFGCTSVVELIVNTSTFRVVSTGGSQSGRFSSRRVRLDFWPASCDFRWHLGCFCGCSPTPCWSSGAWLRTARLATHAAVTQRATPQGQPKLAMTSRKPSRCMNRAQSARTMALDLQESATLV
mmetsp:Transcript_101695/g.286714  ORF Transcript_101695/g.286714 Transcript_101695/m.286714 type:complete len:232 (+) Transcript_101695:1120-1815(+)